MGKLVLVGCSTFYSKAKIIAVVLDLQDTMQVHLIFTQQLALVLASPRHLAVVMS